MNNDILNLFIQRFQLRALPEPLSGRQTRQAAVLIPIVRKENPSILLTRRSSSLRHHPGQIAFPGGAADISDLSLSTTALREANEEIGLNPKDVSILGQLSPQDSISGYRVTPIIGLLPSGLQFKQNSDEVDSLFEVPLTHILRLQNYRTLSVYRRGKESNIYAVPYEEHFIWGLTASILRQLAIQTEFPA
ncbi:8-oxo-dGTP diphosphatase [Leminorella richardii]|uniref:8-oxo-dGTP diphosphatase n=1 Tax=Leminorella richardii TaxID=158841 RepID=A0A2X4V6V2_9GAMM|nr:CoA pyrophosphatase [Leminorella richardii]SQI41010.1 8-oxo-dGTP diphosphatase [Leminorella richardii]